MRLAGHTRALGQRQGLNLPDARSGGLCRPASSGRSGVVTVARSTRTGSATCAQISSPVVSRIWTSAPARRILRPIRTQLGEYVKRVARQQIGGSQEIRTLQNDLREQHRLAADHAGALEDL